ncbi:unnamed protein product, partial [Symbiodinium necroappetens]
MQKDVRATLVDDRDGRFGPLARKPLPIDPGLVPAAFTKARRLDRELPISEVILKLAVCGNIYLELALTQKLTGFSRALQWLLASGLGLLPGTLGEVWALRSFGDSTHFDQKGRGFEAGPVICSDQEIGEQRLLIDPLLVGSLVFFGQRWAFRGRSRAEAVPKPEDVAESFDAIVLTQGLDDHTHRPTLEQVDRRMPIIANPSAASVVRAMGFQDVSVLRPDESLSRGSLRLTAVPGSVVGPPWQ